jgi:hypothetical protein
MQNRATGIVPFGGQPKELILPRETQVITPQMPLSTQGGGVDLREQFEGFIEQYGQMVILQRLNMNIHCQYCWNEIYGEADPQCPHCLGRGYASQLERHVSRRMSSLNAHRQQLLTQSAPGPELIDELFWWFEWDVNPQLEDMVYEVTWIDGSYRLVDKLVTAYRVNYAVPMRGAGGRIEFWRVAASARPIDHTIVGHNLRRLSSIAMYTGADGIVRYGASVPEPREEPEGPGVLVNSGADASPSSPQAGPAAPVPGQTVVNNSFTFTQSAPLTVWTIIHGLHSYPDVVVLDTSGQKVVPDIVYVSDIEVHVINAYPVAGTAYLIG